MNEALNSDLKERLFALRDEQYKAFQEKLIPHIATQKIIGIRTPALRRFALEFAKTPQASLFMANLPHDYYEENNLHALLIEKIKNFDRAVEELNRFLPYVDNWATCDMISPKIFAANREKLLPVVEQWLSSAHPYTVRFGIVMLMKHALDGEFSPHHLKAVSDIVSDEYYIQMAQAWYFAEALVKQYDQALPYLQNGRLTPFVHNKTISKACDSFRIPDDTKRFLKTLRIKNPVTD